MASATRHYDIPFEILEKIISLIDLQSDLLSLALTCRFFHDLIIPDHIDIRHVRCDLFRKQLWDTLVIKRHLAANIRILELVSEFDMAGRLCVTDCRIPRSFAKPADIIAVLEELKVSNGHDAHVASFLAALKHMNNVTIFRWAAGWKPLKSLQPVVDGVERSCVNIKGLFINYFCHAANITAGSLARLQRPRWQFSGLSSVYLSCASASDQTIEYYGKSSLVNMLILECPGLVELYLDFDEIAIPDLLMRGKWETLTRLSICGSVRIFPAEDDPSSNATIMREFLVRNPNIERLYLPNATFFPGSIPVDGVLRLRSLCISPMHGWSWSDIVPSEVAARLEHCSLLTSRSIDFLELTRSLQSCVIDVSPEDLALIFNTSPNLQRLSLRITGRCWSYSDEKLSGIMDSLIDAMVNMKHLTHLEGFMDRIDITSSQGNILLKRTASMPHLKYVSVKRGRKVYWITLMRDDNGRYVGCSEISHKGNYLESYTWGNFFINL